VRPESVKSECGRTFFGLIDSSEWLPLAIGQPGRSLGASLPIRRRRAASYQRRSAGASVLGLHIGADWRHTCTAASDTRTLHGAQLHIEAQCWAQKWPLCVCLKFNPPTASKSRAQSLPATDRPAPTGPTHRHSCSPISGRKGRLRARSSALGQKSGPSRRSGRRRRPLGASGAAKRRPAHLYKTPGTRWRI